MTYAVLTGLVFALTAALVWLARAQGRQAEAEKREREANEANREGNRIETRIDTDPDYRQRVRDEFDES